MACHLKINSRLRVRLVKDYKIRWRAVQNTITPVLSGIKSNAKVFILIN